jgi:hypothetical protein
MRSIYSHCASVLYKAARTSRNDYFIRQAGHVTACVRKKTQCLHVCNKHISPAYPNTYFSAAPALRSMPPGIGGMGGSGDGGQQAAPSTENSTPQEVGCTQTDTHTYLHRMRLTITHWSVQTLGAHKSSNMNRYIYVYIHIYIYTHTHILYMPGRDKGLFFLL